MGWGVFTLESCMFICSLHCFSDVLIDTLYKNFINNDWWLPMMLSMRISLKCVNFFLNEFPSMELLTRTYLNRSLDKKPCEIWFLSLKDYMFVLLISLSDSCFDNLISRTCVITFFKATYLIIVHDMKMIEALCC